MKIHSLNAGIASVALMALLSSPVFAQEDPNHPRVNQVEQRIENQENNVMKAEQGGKLTPAQAARDEKRDQHIQNQLNRDEAKNGGHITKKEQHQLNRELNKEKHHVHKQKAKDAAAK